MSATQESQRIQNQINVMVRNKNLKKDAIFMIGNGIKKMTCLFTVKLDVLLMAT